MWLWQETPFISADWTNVAGQLPLTDLLHSILQLVSLEEDDEDRLVDLVTLWKTSRI